MQPRVDPPRDDALRKDVEVMQEKIQALLHHAHLFFPPEEERDILRRIKQKTDDKQFTRQDVSELDSLSQRRPLHPLQTRRRAYFDYVYTCLEHAHSPDDVWLREYLFGKPSSAGRCCCCM